MENILMGSKKRELISPKADKRYVRRDDQGRIKESDDVGCSLAGDAAKTTVKSGHGDRGDQKRR